MPTDTVPQPAVQDRRGAALATICLSIFVISVDGTIVNVALPTLARQLHASNSQLQWIADAYTLVFAGLLLAAGSLGDRYGRRGALALGLGAFAAASLFASQAGSAATLIGARAAMGIGAALIFPTTLALLTNMFPTGPERAKAIGIWAAMTGAGVATGPIVGGWLLEHFSWGSVFLVNVPVAAVAIVAGRLFVPTSKDPATPPVDVGGVVLSVAGITAVIYTIIEASGWGWSSTRTIAGFAFGALILAAFALWERRHTHPMLDLRVFNNRRFSGASLAVTASYFALFGFIFLITQYFQFVKAYSAFGTGVRLLPVAISIALASVTGPRIAARAGTTAVVAAGLGLFAVGVAWSSSVSAGTSYSEIAAQMVLIGAGMGFTTAPATESIMGSLSVDKAGVGSAVNDTTRELGATLGVAVVGSVFTSVYAYQLAQQSAVSRLPPAARATSARSLAAAYQVASQLGSQPAHQVIAAANHAFLDGLRAGSLVSAGVAAAAAVAVVALLPARATTDAPIARQCQPDAVEVASTQTPTAGASIAKATTD
ncbi:MAG: drug resistance transporter, EmrB/QacA subfamily [Actinomycetia bacterium]|nr:drug resistance transporter, EmrB/QacA subfamily [Actinomycetes bacterium]